MDDMWELKEDLSFLIRTMDINRVRHQKAWEKVRLDRIAKLFTESAHEWVDRVVEFGLSQGLLERCSKKTPEGSVSAIKLAKWIYRK